MANRKLRRLQTWTVSIQLEKRIRFVVSLHNITTSASAPDRHTEVVFVQIMISLPINLVWQASIALVLSFLSWPLEEISVYKIMGSCSSGDSGQNMDQHDNYLYRFA
jgi:hypothetical protein